MVFEGEKHLLFLAKRKMGWRGEGDSLRVDMSQSELEFQKPA